MSSLDVPSFHFHLYATFSLVSITLKFHDITQLTYDVYTLPFMDPLLAASM